MSHNKLYIEVLGGFRIYVEKDGVRVPTGGMPPIRAEYKLLAYLASFGGEASRENLRRALFPDAGNSHVRLRQEIRNLRSELNRITKTEGDRLYLPDNEIGTVVLSAICETDVGVFVRKHRESRDRPPDLERALLEVSAQAYGGPLLLGFESLGRSRRREDFEIDSDVVKNIQHSESQASRNWLLLRRAALEARFDQVCRRIEILRVQSGSDSTAQAEHDDPRISIPDNLPASNLEPFVGRIDEMRSIVDHLTAGALVKLVGTGGCGKTRLAHEVARAIRGQFEAVWVMDLALSKDEAELIGRLARQVGVGDKESLEELLDVVASVIAERPILILLDNCEHLMDASAMIIERLCINKTKVLLTTQFDLDTPGGQRCTVAPLPVPDINALPPAEQLIRENASVELFRAVARLNRDGFEVNEENKEPIARICCAVDGLPLAIKLVASQIRYCEVKDMVVELTEILLPQGDVGATQSTRHHTMIECIGWAYRTLTRSEQILLCRLSLFRAGWTRDQFADVCGFPPITPSDARHLQNVLISKSLVTYEYGIGRYRQLEPIRQFAELQLEQLGERPVMERRLLEWIDRITDDVENRILGQSGMDTSMETAVAEISNIDGAAEQIEPEDPVRAADMRVKAMVLRFASGRLPDAYKTLEAMRRIAQVLPHRASLQIWLSLGEAVFSFLKTDYEQTVSAAARGLELARELNQMDKMSLALCGMGLANVFRGTPEDVQIGANQIREGTELANRINNDWCIALSHMCNGAWLWQQDLVSDAIAQYDLALDGFQNRAKNRILATFVLNSLAHLHCRNGNITLAAEQYLMSIETKNARTTAGCVLGACGLATAMDRFPEAAFFYGAAMKHYADDGAKLIPPVQLDYDQKSVVIKTRCGERYESLYEAGARMSQSDAKTLARVFLLCCRDGATNEFLSLIPEEYGLRERVAGIFD